MNVTDFLRQRRIPFVTLPHGTTFSAQRMAQAIHVSGDKVAKTVVLRLDGGEHVLAVLQATHKIDVQRLEEVLPAARVELVPEDELAALFPDCEIGAVPPFGSAYQMRTIVDESLTHDECIAFEGNTHDEAICIRYEDFAELEHPQVAPFTRHV